MCIMDVNEAGPRDTDTVIVINHEKIKQKKQPSKIQDNGIHGAREADNYCNPLRRQVLLHKVTLSLSLSHFLSPSLYMYIYVSTIPS